MKRWLSILLLAFACVQLGSPALAGRRVVVRRGVHRRTVVVVHRGWPLRRPLRTAVIHPVRAAARVSAVTCLAPVVFTGVVIAAATAPEHDRIAWEDAETLTRDEGWAEFTLNCDSRGKRLWLEIAMGKVQLDWAEIVFENGEAQVVDFAGKTHDAGLYSLLDFKDGRKVDHVRVLARAKSDEARVVLRMEKE